VIRETRPRELAKRDRGLLSLRKAMYVQFADRCVRLPFTTWRLVP
jgi:hypothetical protein